MRPSLADRDALQDSARPMIVDDGPRTGNAQPKGGLFGPLMAVDTRREEFAYPPVALVLGLFTSVRPYRPRPPLSLGSQRSLTASPSMLMP